MGPAALRTAGLMGQLANLGLTVEDIGDVRPRSPDVTHPAPANTRHWFEIAAWTAAIAERVAESLHDGALPLVMGGDHSLSAGSVAGAARFCRAQDRPLSVLWVDAHADVNTPATSPSGNLHGMPVAALTGEAELAGLFGDEAPRVPHSNVHLFGLRSIDPGERALLRMRRMDVVDMRTLDEDGVAVPLGRILDRVAARHGLLHVSLDVDFLDPMIAPGVGTTVPGGATFREAHLVMEMLHDSGLVGSVDVVELNPFLDERGRTALLMVDLIASLFGRQVFDRPTPTAYGQA